LFVEGQRVAFKQIFGIPVEWDAKTFGVTCARRTGGARPVLPSEDAALRALSSALRGQSPMTAFRSKLPLPLGGRGGDSVRLLGALLRVGRAVG
jgi:hypothetical protein